MLTSFKKFWILLLLFSGLTACTLPLEVRYQSFHDQNYASRAQAATIYQGSINDLISGEHLLIGYIDVKRNMRKCFDGAKTCETITEALPTEKDILTEAAQRGGDLVVLLEDKPSVESIFKNVCTAHTTYSYVIDGKTYTNSVCVASINIHGRLESFISRALVWRKTPGEKNVEKNTEAISVALSTLAKEYGIDPEDQDKDHETQTVAQARDKLNKTLSEEKEEDNTPAPAENTQLSKEATDLKAYYDRIARAFVVKHPVSDEETLRTRFAPAVKMFLTLNLISENYVHKVTPEYLLQRATDVLALARKNGPTANKPIKPVAFDGDSQSLIDRFAENYIAWLPKNGGPPQDTINNLLTALVNNIDPDGHYYTRDEMQSWSSKNPVYGLGIQFKKIKDKVLVIKVKPDSKAYLAGLRSGDYILEIDRQSVQDLQGTNLISRFQGPKDSNVSLKVKRKDRIKTIVVKRESLKDYSTVVSRILDGKIAYVGVTQLSYRDGEEVVKSVKEFAGTPGLKGMILDLRYNSGGVLTVPVDISDLFIDSGMIASINGRTADSNLGFNSTNKSPYPKSLPLVVLVDGETASGAEIMVAALKKLRGATVIGTGTAGKGAVGTMFTGLDGDSVKITTGQILTAEGRFLSGAGVTPDYCVSFQADKMRAKRLGDKPNERCERNMFTDNTQSEQVLAFAKKMILTGARNP